MPNLYRHPVRPSCQAFWSLLRIRAPQVWISAPRPLACQRLHTWQDACLSWLRPGIHQCGRGSRPSFLHGGWRHRYQSLGYLLSYSALRSGLRVSWLASLRHAHSRCKSAHLACRTGYSLYPGHSKPWRLTQELLVGCAGRTWGPAIDMAKQGQDLWSKVLQSRGHSWFFSHPRYVRPCLQEYLRKVIWSNLNTLHRA